MAEKIKNYLKQDPQKLPLYKLIPLIFAVVLLTIFWLGSRIFSGVMSHFSGPAQAQTCWYTPGAASTSSSSSSTSCTGCTSGGCGNSADAAAAAAGAAAAGAAAAGAASCSGASGSCTGCTGCGASCAGW